MADFFGRHEACETVSSPCRLYDILFVLAAAVFAIACLQGSLALTGTGALLDSDLGTYAQGMAARAQPELFGQDPVLRTITHHNSIWNVQTFLATLLTPGESYATGLLRSGALAIFLYLVSWYLLGRYLFQRPCFAVLLVLVQSITCWVGWGTFWGPLLSEPVPRVWYAALWPLLVWGTLEALKRPGLQPLVMLACGLCTWVHSISALAGGAMTFAAFALCKHDAVRWPAHLARCLLSLLCFFVPVLLFVWPTLSEEHEFTHMSFGLLREVFLRRYAKDYGSFAGELDEFLTSYSIAVPLFPLAAAAFVFCLLRGTAQVKALCRLYGPFLLAILFVVCFSWAEGQWALSHGRMPLGHEIVRGIRFLIPLAWLALVAACASLLAKYRTLSRAGVLFVLAALLTQSPDRQLLAALHSLHLEGVSAHQAEIRALAAEGQSRATVFTALRRLTSPGDVVFCRCPEPNVVRYYALRGLVHCFKDGANAFYDRDISRAQRWLHYENLLRASPAGYITAWLESGVSWLVSDRPEDKAELQKYGEVVWENQEWLIVRRHAG